MALARHHVPFDGTAHVVMLGEEPEEVTTGHTEDEDPGVTFWADRNLHNARPFVCKASPPGRGIMLAGPNDLAH